MNDKKSFGSKLTFQQLSQYSADEIVEMEHIVSEWRLMQSDPTDQGLCAMISYEEDGNGRHTEKPGAGEEALGEGEGEGEGEGCCGRCGDCVIAEKNSVSG